MIKIYVRIEEISKAYVNKDNFWMKMDYKWNKNGVEIEWKLVEILKLKKLCLNREK
jgi:hypothetical protein